MWRCNDELRVRAEELHRNSKKDEVAKHYIGDNLKKKNLERVTILNASNVYLC
jgi:hypothetical protein